MAIAKRNLCATIPSMQLTYEQLQAALWIIVAVMLIVVLYHVLFIVVDLRKILRRFESLSSEVELMIMKPLSMASEIIQWLTEFLDSKKKARGGEHHKKSTKAFPTLPV